MSSHRHLTLARPLAVAPLFLAAALSLAITSVQAKDKQAFPPTEATAEPKAHVPLHFDLSAAMEWDGDLFLQDSGPLANQSSFITRAVMGLEWEPLAGTPGKKAPLQIGYSFGHAEFWDESSENNWTHTLKLAANGTLGSAPWTVKSNFKLVDGNSETPIYLGCGGAPSFGGVEIMARRDGFTWTGSGDIQFGTPFGFVRPLGYWKWNNYMTRQQEIAGYLNYTDRSDTGGGVDLGFALSEKAHFVLGYRAGYQWEDEILDDPIQYSNTYQRILAGVEGEVGPVKMKLLAGPDFRSFGGGTAPGFDRGELLWFIDGELSATIGKADTLKLTLARFEQPGFCGRSIYEDILHGLSWRHKFGERVTSELGVQAHAADFQAPTTREDWIFTLNAALEWRLTDNTTIRAFWQADDGQSMVPNTPSREYQRGYGGIEVRVRAF